MWFSIYYYLFSMRFSVLLVICVFSLCSFVVSVNGLMAAVLTKNCFELVLLSLILLLSFNLSPFFIIFIWITIYSPFLLRDGLDISSSNLPLTLPLAS